SPVVLDGTGIRPPDLRDVSANVDDESALILLKVRNVGGINETHVDAGDVAVSVRVRRRLDEDVAEHGGQTNVETLFRAPVRPLPDLAERALEAAAKELVLEDDGVRLFQLTGKEDGDVKFDDGVDGVAKTVDSLVLL